MEGSLEDVLRLQDCILDMDGGGFVIAPVQRRDPEKRWIDARDSTAIPPKLYELYETASFLSFGAGPRFLTDDRNILFSYFGLVLNCLLDAFVDAKRELADFVTHESLSFDPIKKIRGEHWEPDAPMLARRHLRNFLIALDATLDTLTDLIAIFLTGRIHGIRLGRGEFRLVEQWVAKPLGSRGLVLTPYDGHLQALYDAVKPLVLTAPPEQDWLPLMHMLRNKSIHLGQGMLRQVGLHDSAGNSYIFLPRRWPFIWERDFEPSNASRQSPQAHLPTVFGELLMHQDILTFTEGLRQKVIAVAQAILSEILVMYRVFQDFETNRAAIEELDKSSVTFRFENFL